MKRRDFLASAAALPLVAALPAEGLAEATETFSLGPPLYLDDVLVEPFEQIAKFSQDGEFDICFSNSDVLVLGVGLSLTNVQHLQCFYRIKSGGVKEYLDTIRTGYTAITATLDSVIGPTDVLDLANIGNPFSPVDLHIRTRDNAVPVFDIKLTGAVVCGVDEQHRSQDVSVLKSLLLYARKMECMYF